MKPWVRAAAISGGLLVVPAVALGALLIFSKSDVPETAATDAPRDFGPASPSDPPDKRVQSCCKALTQLAAGAEIADRPAYGQAAKQCRELTSGGSQDATTTLSMIASSLRVGKKHVPPICEDR